MKKLLIAVFSIVIFAVGGYCGALFILKFLNWQIDQDRKYEEARRSARRGYSGSIPRSRERVDYGHRRA